MGKTITWELELPIELSFAVDAMAEHHETTPQGMVRVFIKDACYGTRRAQRVVDSYMSRNRKAGAVGILDAILDLRVKIPLGGYAPIREAIHKHTAAAAAAGVRLQRGDLYIAHTSPSLLAALEREGHGAVDLRASLLEIPGAVVTANPIATGDGRRRAIVLAASCLEDAGVEL